MNLNRARSAVGPVKSYSIPFQALMILMGSNVPGAGHKLISFVTAYRKQ